MYSQKRLLYSFILLLCMSAAMIGQQKTAMLADQTLRSNGRVNPSTLGLEISIPLASYPGRGGTNVPISLQYSSKLWRMEYLSIDAPQTEGDCHGHYTPRFGELSASGWTTDVTRPYIEYTGWDNPFDANGNPASLPGFGGCGSVDTNGTSVVRRITVHLPGGSTHELRPDDTVVNYYSPNTPSSVPKNGTYYSADGSNLIYTEASGTRRLLLTDGSYIDFATSLDTLTTGGQGRTVRYAVSHTDKTGSNTTTYNAPDSNYPNGSVTDTMGRVIAAPIGIAPPVEPTPVSSPQDYEIPGIGTTTITYKLHWKKLKGSTAGESALTDFNDTLCYKARGRRNLGAPQPPSGSCKLFNDGYDTYPTDFAVANPADGEFNPVVLTEIELPNGASYKFGYDIFGRIDRIDYPTGGYETVTYLVVGTLAWETPDVVEQTNFGVAQRKVYESSEADPIEWGYGISIQVSAPHGLIVSTVAPNGVRTDRYVLRGEDYTVCGEGCSGGYGYTTTLAGMPYEEQVFSSSDELLSKTITTWEESNFSISNGTGSYLATADWHPRATKVEQITYDPATTAFLSGSSTTDYGGDLNQRSTALNPTVSKVYGFSTTVGILGSLQGSTETVYETGTDYTSRNLRSLPTQVVSKDPAGNVKAKTAFSYDDSNYGISGVFGLLTMTTSWYDIAGNLFVTSKLKYDSYGNLTEATDGKGNITTTSYSSTYAHAYPTGTTTPVPDSTGTHGSNTAFTATTTYDYNTGLPLSSTDINGQTTVMEYDDPLLRPRKVTAPNGRQTITEYGAGTSPSTRWVKARSQIDGTNWKEAITWFDGLGRGVLSQSVMADEDDIFAVTCYDDMGRVLKSSNPVRGSTAPTCVSSLEWTTPAYDDLGRTISVTTPDGAAVTTDYSLATTGNEIGTMVTVMDQAGKLRRSITNALGHLKRVDEPNDAGQLGSVDNPNQKTVYSYDLLNNLITVSQGVQTRSFSYDAISRLTSATNPESGTIAYTYDANSNLVTKIDARNITTTYAYDTLNRVKTRLYTNEPSGSETPNVSYFYDTLSNANGKLIKVTSSVSTTEYTDFDILGRVTGHKQTTDGKEYENEYTYNLSGALVGQAYPSGRRVKNVIDNNGDLSIVQSAKCLDGTPGTNAECTSQAGVWNYAQHFTYNAAGAVTAMQLGNGRWESTAFNARLQPTQIGLGVTPGATNLLKLNYEYGATAAVNNGNVTKQTINVPTVGQTPGFTAVQDYTYDSLNRLKSATENITPTGGSQSMSWEQTFEFDRYGNRNFIEANTNITGFEKLCGSETALCEELRKVLNPAVNQSDNRLSSSDGYVFDDSGNTTRDPQLRKFTYDAENKQVKVESVNSGGTVTGTIGEYVYDGDGKRIKKIVPSAVAPFDDEVTVFVYDAAGKLVAEYATEISQDPKVSYTTADHLGSPRILTDENGATISRRDFHPFGEEILTTDRHPDLGYTPDDVRQKFTGYERDNETELDFAQARMYGNSHGRFTSPDPTLLSVNGFNPQSWNRYTYVLNNPYLYTDPLGLWELTYEERTKDKKNKDGTITKVYERTIVTAVKTDKDDNGASLAKQLGLTGKDATKFAEKVGGGDNIRLSEQGGDVGRVFGAVESGLTNQKKWENDNKDKLAEKAADGQYGPTHSDCSRTACQIGLGRFLGLQVGTDVLDPLLDTETRNVTESDAQVGDIIRYAKENNVATHFANFIFRNDDGTPVAFSKSGVKGRYETRTASSLQVPNYGTIRGRNDDPSGYYRRR